MQIPVISQLDAVFDSIDLDTLSHFMLKKSVEQVHVASIRKSIESLNYLQTLGAGLKPARDYIKERTVLSLRAAYAAYRGKPEGEQSLFNDICQ